MSKSEFHKIALEIKPSRFIDYKNYLKEMYLHAKQHFGRYSYIKFTEELGLGHCNAMYLIIHGKRPLTLKAAKRIVQALGLVGIERQYFLKLVEVSKVTDPAERDKAFDALLQVKSRALPRDIDKDHLKFYTEWYHGAILELLGQRHSSGDPEWLAKTLIPRITPTKAQQSLELLEKIGFVKHDSDTNRLVPSQEHISTGPEVIGMAVISYHQQMIQLAKESLTRIDPFDRNISSVTISLNRAEQELLKQKMDEFRREIIGMSEESAADKDVMQVNLQMFPLAKTGKEPSDE